MNILCISEVLFLVFLSKSFATNLGTRAGPWDNRGNRDGFYLDESEGSAGWLRPSADNYQSGNGGLYDRDDEDSARFPFDDHSGDGSLIVDSNNNRGLSECEKLYKKVSDQKLVGAYVPRCTNTGDFDALQCHSSSGDCWCVNKMGQRIPNSGISPGAPPPRCDDYDREIIYPVESRPVGQFPPSAGNTQPPPRLGGGTRDSAWNPPGGDEDKPGVSIDVMFSTSKAPAQTAGGKYPIVKSEGLAWNQPFVLAGIIGGAVVGLLCAVLLVMFIVYRMRKKDEGSYSLDEKKYHQVPHKEYYA
jgi:hypothetical protein